MFCNEAHLVTFFTDLGLKVDMHPLQEVAQELVSPERLGIGKEKVFEMLQRRYGLVMSV